MEVVWVVVKEEETGVETGVDLVEVKEEVMVADLVGEVKVEVKVVGMEA